LNQTALTAVKWPNRVMKREAQEHVAAHRRGQQGK
jgi:hypothetical protein